MAAFRAEDDVNAAHVANGGGADGGALGYREADEDDFYVAYLRDPLGNKVAIFFVG